MAKWQIALRIICVDPIRFCPGADAHQFGLQDKKQHLHAGESLSADELVFEFALTVQQQSDGTANFTGAFAHGPRAKRFVYLTCKAREGETWSIFRRIKVALKSISWEQVEAALATDRVLQANVSGLQSGTAPLLDGCWLTVN